MRVELEHMCLKQFQFHTESISESHSYGVLVHPSVLDLYVVVLISAEYLLKPRVYLTSADYVNVFFYVKCILFTWLGFLELYLFFNW